MKKLLHLCLMLFTLNSFIYAQDNTSKEALIIQADKGDYGAMLNLVKYHNFPKTKEGLLHFNKWKSLIEKNIGHYDFYEESKVIDLYFLYHDMIINGEAYYKKITQASELKISQLFSDKISLIQSYYKKRQYKQALYFLEKISNNISDEQNDKLFNSFSNNLEFKKTTLHDEREAILFKLKVLALNKKITSTKDRAESWHSDRDITKKYIKSVIELNNAAEIVFVADELTKFRKNRNSTYYRKRTYSQEYIDLFNIAIKIHPSKSGYYEMLFEIYRELELHEKASELIFKILYADKKYTQNLVNSFYMEDIVNNKSELLLNSPQGKLLIAIVETNAFEDDKRLAAYDFIDKRIKENDINAIYYAKMLFESDSLSRLNKESLQKLEKLNRGILKYKIIDKAYAINQCACDFISAISLEESVIDIRKEALKYAKPLSRNKYNTPTDNANQLQVYHFFKKAASMGDIASEFYLADFFLDGHFIQYFEAEKILLTLERKGSTRAREKLLALYLDENYVSQSNLLKAIDMLSSLPLSAHTMQLTLVDIYLDPRIKNDKAAEKILRSLEKENMTASNKRRIAASYKKLMLMKRTQ